MTTKDKIIIITMLSVNALTLISVFIWWVAK